MTKTLNRGNQGSRGTLKGTKKSHHNSREIDPVAPTEGIRVDISVIITASRGPGFERYLEGESLFALRLPPDDDDTDGAEQSQNDDGHHDACTSVPQLLETVGQDDAEYSDKNGCRETRRTESY